MPAAGSSPPFSLDVNGWYVYSPTGNTYYVSDSVGNDANDGLSTSTPKKTIAAGWGLVRDGFGDTLLLARGDTFTNQVLAGAKAGASVTDPIVVGAYGTGARPLIRLSTDRFYRSVVGTQMQNILVLDGLDLIQYTRDPSDPAFNVAEVNRNAVDISNGVDLMLMQDCRVRFFSYALLVQPANSVSPQQTVQNIILHRNIIAMQWGTNSQGFFVKDATDSTVTENTLYGNGWDEAGLTGERSVFNHSMYNKECDHVTWARNYSLRAAAQGCKMSSDTLNGTNNFINQHNYYWHNGHGIQFDHSQASPEFAVQDSDILDNAFEALDGDQVISPTTYGVVYNHARNLNILRNLYIHKLTPPLGTAVIRSAVGQYENIIVADNVIHDWTLNVGRPDSEKINHSGAATWVNSDDLDSNNKVDLGTSAYVDSTRSLDSYAVTQGFTDFQDMYDTDILVRGYRSWTDARHNAKLARDWVAAGFVLATVTQISVTMAGVSSMATQAAVLVDSGAITMPGSGGVSAIVTVGTSIFAGIRDFVTGWLLGASEPSIVEISVAMPAQSGFSATANLIADPGAIVMPGISLDSVIVTATGNFGAASVMAATAIMSVTDSIVTRSVSSTMAATASMTVIAEVLSTGRGPRITGLLTGGRM